MAEMTGAHVEMGIAVRIGTSELFYPIWSETIALGGVTNQVAKSDPALKDVAAAGVLVFRVRAQSAGAIYVATGDAPVANVAVSTGKNNTRSHMVLSETRDFPATVGHKLAIATAI